MIPAWFDEKYYLASKQSQLALQGAVHTVDQIRQIMADAGMTPYMHYTSYGDGEGLSPGQYINRYEYLEAKARQLNAIKYQDKTSWDSKQVAEEFAKAGVTVGTHYALNGWKEHINPSNAFDTTDYLAAKVDSIRRLPGADTTGKLYATYELGDILAAFTSLGIDPVSHYLLYGQKEGLPAPPVPASELVPDDPFKQRGPVLAGDGKTVTVHMQSPIKADSIDLGDFAITVGGVAAKVDTVTAGKEQAAYDLVITLADADRIPGPGAGDAGEIRVIYNPDGGSTSQLSTDAGLVAPFNQAVTNTSRCFDIVERTTQEGASSATTLHVSITPPAGYIPPTDPATYVKVDLSAKNGVVSGGADGLVTAPRLMDGAQVNNLDTRGVAGNVPLNITARAEGGEIITGEGGDSITFGAGQDTLVLVSKTVSQLSHLDAVKGFTYDAAEGSTSADKVRFNSGDISQVVFKGPLSLEGTLMEKAIQGVFGAERMASNTAYLLQDGKNSLLVADCNGNGVFEAANDFALSLVELTGLPDGLTPGATLNAMLG